MMVANRKRMNLFAVIALVACSIWILYGYGEKKGEAHTLSSVDITELSVNGIHLGESKEIIRRLLGDPVDMDNSGCWWYPGGIGVAYDGDKARDIIGHRFSQNNLTLIQAGARRAFSNRVLVGIGPTPEERSTLPLQAFPTWPLVMSRNERRDFFWREKTSYDWLPFVLVIYYSRLDDVEAIQLSRSRDDNRPNFFKGLTQGRPR